MIDTKTLEACGMDFSSKNDKIQKIFYVVKEYNATWSQGVSKDNNTRCINLLDELMLDVCAFLTSKPPRFGQAKPGKAHTSNQQRWDALDELTQQCRREAGLLGVQQVHSPGKWQDVAGNQRDRWNLWLENADPQHRAGHRLSAKYADWLADAKQHAVPDFWTYLGGALGLFQVMQLDQDEYKIEFRNDGLAYDSLGGLVDTEPPPNQPPIDGSQIFVYQNENLYMSHFSVGHVHHSSLSDGKSITAAGHMVAKDGEILFIVFHTGHYQTSLAEATRFAQQCRQMNPKAFILPDFNSPARVYTFDNFRKFGTKAPTVDKGTLLTELTGKAGWVFTTAKYWLGTWFTYGGQVAAPPPGGGVANQGGAPVGTDDSYNTPTNASPADSYVTPSTLGYSPFPRDADDLTGNYVDVEAVPSGNGREDYNS